MPKDARIIDPTTGHRLNFTCENARYKSDITRGHPHGPQTGNPGGSVYEDAIMTSNGWSLWLEHVTEKRNGKEVFWLMWYDPDGMPTIPMSGVFSRDDFKEMVGRLATRL